MAVSPVNSAHKSTAPERLQLPRLDRLIYFAPALFFAYLAALCGALILTSIFLVRVRNPEAIAGAGVFGLLVTAGLGTLLVRAQLNDLRYTRITTQADAQRNYALVLDTMRAAGWVITRTEQGALIDARIAAALLSRGEWIAVRFRDCDPRIGFSLVARKRCRHYKELIKAAVRGAV
jgi:hypothetical protein